MVNAQCMVDSDPEGQVCLACHTVLGKPNWPTHRQRRQSSGWDASQSLQRKHLIPEKKICEHTSRKFGESGIYE